MADHAEASKQLLDGTGNDLNRKQTGDKIYHYKSSLTELGEDEEGILPEDVEIIDPEVQNNVHLSNPIGLILSQSQTQSQPGPESGSPTTVNATRAWRKPPNNVMYAPEVDNDDRQSNLYIVNELAPATHYTVDENSLLPDNIQNSYNSNGDNKSLSSYRLYASANDLRGNANSQKRSVATIDAQSLHSIDMHAPPPTSPEDNYNLTSTYFTQVMSAIYAVLLVTFGIIFHAGNTFVGEDVSLIYSLCLCCIGFVYITILMVDINRYKSIALKNHRTKGLHEEKISKYFRKQEEEYGTNSPSTPGDRTSDSTFAVVPPLNLIPLKHLYCFSQGRHSGSFYLKMGATAFAIGHLVHSVLVIAIQLSHLFDAEISNDDCFNVFQVILEVLFPCYCFHQLYFIFKYSNVIVLRGQGLARFAFMHMIGSSLCFWVSAISRETILALTIYANSINGNEYSKNISKNYECDSELEAKSVYNILDVSSLYNENCTGSPAINAIAENFLPYLYPFSVEFNILIVAIYFIIWNNIGNCHNDDTNSENISTLDENYVCKIFRANEANDFSSNIVIYADCHGSNRGLFAGIMLLVVVIGFLILGFVFSSVGGDFLGIGYLLNDCLKLGLHSAMLIAAVFTFNQLRKLDINAHPVSLLDDVLLFICLPAFIMETVLSMIATVNILNIIKSVDVIVMMVQVIIQTPLIMDGLRRCSNSKKLRRSKPGRELIMFLLIANVSMWLFNTFSYKSPDSLDERYEYYGKVLWTILGHVSLPLIMFYRFHSSVCFADIWDAAYKPGSEH